MPWIDAFAPVEASYVAQVMGDTWGHLAPRKGITYRGYVVFAIGCFGSDHLNPTPLTCKFKSRKYGELESSPWFYSALLDFLSTIKTTDGNVYRFDGAFINYEFKGTVRRMQIL